MSQRCRAAQVNQTVLIRVGVAVSNHQETAMEMGADVLGGKHAE